MRNSLAAQLNGMIKGFGYVPSQFESNLQSFSLDTYISTPLCKRLRFVVMSIKSYAACVIALFFFCDPSPVFRLIQLKTLRASPTPVPFVIVNSIKRAVLRGVAHVSEEGFKIQPIGAYGYAPPAVLGVVRVARIGTSGGHVLPHSIDWCGVQSVLCYSISIPTTATLGLAGSETPCADLFENPTVATAHPNDLPIQSIFLSVIESPYGSNGQKAYKPLSRQIVLGSTFVGKLLWGKIFNRHSSFSFKRNLLLEVSGRVTVLWPRFLFSIA